MPVADSTGLSLPCPFLSSSGDTGVSQRSRRGSCAGGPCHLPHLWQCHGSRPTEQPQGRRAGKQRRQPTHHSHISLSSRHILTTKSCPLTVSCHTCHPPLCPSHNSQAPRVPPHGLSSHICHPPCSSQNIGECTAHARQCGAGHGIFLMVNKGSIVLMRDSRAAFYPVRRQQPPTPTTRAHISKADADDPR